MMNTTDPDRPGQGPLGDDPAGRGQSSAGQDSFSTDFAPSDEGRHSALPFREDRDGGTQWNADFASAPSDREAAEKRERSELRNKIVKGAFFVGVFVFISVVFFFIRKQHRMMGEDFGGSSFGDVSGGSSMGGFFGLIDSFPFSPMFLFVGLFVVVTIVKPLVRALWGRRKK